MNNKTCIFLIAILYGGVTRKTILRRTYTTRRIANRRVGSKVEIATTPKTFSAKSLGHKCTYTHGRSSIRDPRGIEINSRIPPLGPTPIILESRSAKDIKQKSDQLKNQEIFQLIFLLPHKTWITAIFRFNQCRLKLVHRKSR